MDQEPTLSPQPLPVNNILHGDCVTLMKNLPAESVDLTVTSPPYDNIRNYGGNTFEPEAVIHELLRIHEPGGIVVWVVQDTVDDDRCLSTSSYKHVHLFKAEGWTWHDEITLVRVGRRFPATQRRYGPCEKAFVFSKGRPKTVNMLRDRPNKCAGERIRRNMRQRDTLVKKITDEFIQPFGFRLGWWLYSGGGLPKDVIGDHPARMPEQIAKDLILSYSQVGDVVFDPMAGSGTTCKMAFLHGRSYLGMEIHEPYVQIAQKRLRIVRQKRAVIA